MDPTFEFSVNGLNMEFTIHLAADGHSIPELLFVDILTEKTFTSTYQIFQGLFNVSCKYRMHNGNHQTI